MHYFIKADTQSSPLSMHDFYFPFQALSGSGASDIAPLVAELEAASDKLEQACSAPVGREKSTAAVDSYQGAKQALSKHIAALNELAG